ncbi:hypothetical protein DFJ73DRAFT_861174 [Zopfochytrium polystomum]|nr:hypothetical protein DFJ73DRAFT_861174 [Zopfochytrium polystomum]
MVDQIVDDLRPLTGGGRIEDATLRTKLDAISKDAPIASDLVDVLNAVAESLVARSTLLYGRLVAAAGDVLAEALFPNVDTGTAKMDGEEDNEQSTPVATADTFPADALLPNVDSAMAEMGVEEEASPPQSEEFGTTVDSSLIEGGGMSEQDYVIDYYALSRIPDPRNMTLEQLGVLLESRIARCPRIYERDRTIITRYTLCCFFKHAIRYFNEEEGNTIKWYVDDWSEWRMTLEERETKLGDKLLTFFEQGTVLLLQGINDPAVQYQVTFLRSIQLYATGEGHLLFMQTYDGEVNYKLEEVNSVFNDYASVHSCALIGEGLTIAVFDYCWNPCSFIRQTAATFRFMAVTPGPHEELVRGAAKSLEFLLEDY